jgi:glycosyltransferase involved in cell wall biosynthesis
LVENLSVPFDRRVWHECTTLVAGGYEVSVICPEGKGHDTGSYEELDGVRIHRYPHPPSATSLSGYFREYPFMLWWTFRLARRIWRARPFDTIHACNPPDLFFLIGSWFRPRGVSFVFDQHDACPEILLAKRHGVRVNGLPELVVTWAERLTYALADVVIAPNDSYRGLAVSRGHKNERDVFVVRSAPRVDEFSLDRAGGFDRRGHRHLIAYLGVMGRQDGVDLLVRAAVSLVRKGYDVLLYLAGDGETHDEIRDLARELGIDDRVLMPGYQSDREFTPALMEADVCVAPDPPSSFNDISTMNKIIEYMALGRPCVAFGLPENRTSGGDAVVYADPGGWEPLADAIAGLLDDDRSRSELGPRARGRFEQVLAWEHQAPRLLQAYERLQQKVAGS